MKLRICNNDGYALFFCPACNDVHAINVGQNGWEYNGNPDSPVTNPSIRVFQDEITLSGSDLIRYCDDSPHEFAGRRIPLSDYPQKYM